MINYNVTLAAGTAVANRVTEEKVATKSDLLGFGSGILDFVLQNWPLLLELFRGVWADEAWTWFDANRDTKIIKVDKWFIHFTFRVKHCGWLVKKLCGPRPDNTDPDEPVDVG